MKESNEYLGLFIMWWVEDIIKYVIFIDIIQLCFLKSKHKKKATITMFLILPSEFTIKTPEIIQQAEKIA